MCFTSGEISKKKKKKIPKRSLGKKKKKPLSQIRKAWRMRQEFTLILRI